MPDILVEANTGTTASRRHAAIVIGIYATLMLDFFGSVTSSPQTTELFAKDRDATLMKYVYLADAGGFVIGAAMSIVDKSIWPLIGTTMIAVPMHLLYVHAAKVGKDMDPPKTASQQ